MTFHHMRLAAVMLKRQSSLDATCRWRKTTEEVREMCVSYPPVLRVVAPAQVGTLQLLQEDANDANEEQEVHLEK